jgi:hypothetical protein
MFEQAGTYLGENVVSENEYLSAMIADRERNSWATAE